MVEIASSVAKLCLNAFSAPVRTFALVALMAFTILSVVAAFPVAMF